jgi:hypothetical protein
MSTPQEVQSGMIHIGSMLSFRAFERWGEEHGYEEWLRSWIQPQWAAWLVFLLQAEPDTPELFPHGKWATIQRLQELVLLAAAQELKDAR